MAQSVLFLCNLNTVRSPMAAALLRQHNSAIACVESAGIEEGEQNPFVEAVMLELGVSLDHVPKALDTLRLEDFDVIIALTPHAAATIRQHCPSAMIEFWDTGDPSETMGAREAILESSRACRAALTERIAARFEALAE